MEGTKLIVDVLNPDDAYTGKKTGTEFVNTQDKDKAEHIDENFFTSGEIKNTI